MTEANIDLLSMGWPFACEYDGHGHCEGPAEFTLSVEENGAPVAARQSCAHHVLDTIEWALAYPVPFDGEAADAYLTHNERRVTVSAFA